MFASVEEIVPHKLLKKLVAVQLADQTARVVVVGDVCRILGEQVTDDLVDRVITFSLSAL